MPSSRPMPGEREIEAALTDPARLEVLKMCGHFDLETDAAFDRIARLARRMLGTGAAAVTLLDDNNQYVKAMATTEPVAPFATPAREAGCKFVVGAGGDPVVVSDTSEFEDWRALPSVRRGEVGAYLGAPLATSEGHVLGALCALDPQPRVWTSDETELLGELAGAVMQIFERRAAELLAERRAAQARAAEARYRRLAEAAFEGIAISENGRITECNAALEAMFGYPPEGMIGLHSNDLLVGDEHEVSRVRSLAGRDTFSAIAVRRDGTTFPIESRGRVLIEGERTLRLAAVRDVTAEVAAKAKLAEQAQALRELSLRDELTGLNNRRGFLELAGQLLRQADRSKHAALLFYCDLNGLKIINDVYGHEQGDEAIRALAGLLRKTFRDSDVLARLGGDEFVVLAPDAAPEHIGAFRERLWRNIQAWNDAAKRPWKLSASVGAEPYHPLQPRSLDALLQAADASLYREKATRKATGRSTGSMSAVVPPRHSLFDRKTPPAAMLAGLPSLTRSADASSLRALAAATRESFPSAERGERVSGEWLRLFPRDERAALVINPQPKLGATEGGIDNWRRDKDRWRDFWSFRCPYADGVPPAFVAPSFSWGLMTSAALLSLGKSCTAQARRALQASRRGCIRRARPRTTPAADRRRYRHKG